MTDAQWALLDPLIPKPKRRKDGRGRPWKERRAVLNGILYISRTGAPWADLPERFPPYQTCHRRFQQWVRSGVMRGILEALADDLRACAGFHLHEAFIDGSFAPAKRPGLGVGKTKRGKGASRVLSSCCGIYEMRSIVVKSPWTKPASRVRGRHGRIWQDKLPCRCTCRCLVNCSVPCLSPKQSRVIPFNTHKAIVLPNPKGFRPRDSFGSAAFAKPCRRP